MEGEIQANKKEKIKIKNKKSNIKKTKNKIKNIKIQKAHKQRLC